MMRKQTDGRSHREITDLLPWYVNGTLAPAERDEVAAHLAGCPDCLAEAGILQSVSSAVQDLNERLPLPSDGQLDVLLSRIEKEWGERLGEGPFARLKEWWAALPASAKWALVAQAVAVVALAFASAALLRRANLSEAAALRERQDAEALQGRQRAGGPESTPAQEGPEANYKALSGPQEKVSCTGVQITVVFREGATEKEIRELLAVVHATFIDGPTAARFYELCIAVPPGADAQKLVDEALALLRGRADVVRLAEPAP
jgi:Putative zinc-finger